MHTSLISVRALTRLSASSLHSLTNKHLLAYQVPRPRSAMVLKLGLLNIRSLTPKAVIVNEMVTDNNFDVLCLTETQWWNVTKYKYFVSLLKYIFSRIFT